MTETYTHLYGLRATGLRYFTVYGPWGRPDMAPYIFARAILAGTPIELFHHGEVRRDFSYMTTSWPARSPSSTARPISLATGSTISRPRIARAFATSSHSSRGLSASGAWIELEARPARRHGGDLGRHRLGRW